MSRAATYEGLSAGPSCTHQTNPPETQSTKHQQTKETKNKAKPQQYLLFPRKAERGGTEVSGAAHHTGSSFGSKPQPLGCSTPSTPPPNRERREGNCLAQWLCPAAAQPPLPTHPLSQGLRGSVPCQNVQGLSKGLHFEAILGGPSQRAPKDVLLKTRALGPCRAPKAGARTAQQRFKANASAREQCTKRARPLKGLYLRPSFGAPPRGPQKMPF
jgi:hypothetical protein